MENDFLQQQIEVIAMLYKGIMLEYAKEAGYPLDNIYKADWLKKPLADPSSVVFTYLDTSLQHTMSP